MGRMTVLSILCLVIGCSGVSTPRVADPLLQAAGKVQAVTLVNLETRKEEARLSTAEVVRLNRILQRAEESSGYSTTTPPWEVAMILKITGTADVIVHFAPPGLRFSRHTPWSNGANVTDPEWEAKSVDLDLLYEDTEWLWDILGGYLGGTTVKEYRALPKRELFRK